MWLSLHTTHGGGEHECSDIGDSSSRLCGEVVFGGTAGGVVVEGLGDNTQRLGMVEDTHWGTSSQAAISRRRSQGAAGCARCVGLHSEAVSAPKQAQTCMFIMKLRSGQRTNDEKHLCI